MNPTPCNADLPPPLMTSEPGSFARLTIVERKPHIIRQVIEDNGYTSEIVEALEAFKREIARDSICPLDEQSPDAVFWNRELSAYRGKTWLEVPLPRPKPVPVAGLTSWCSPLPPARSIAHPTYMP